MPKGTIRRLMDRGFGFIKTEEEEDLFFHRNDLEGVEFASLSEGQEVEFEKGQGRDGRPQAVKVKLAQPEGEQHQTIGEALSGLTKQAIVTSTLNETTWTIDIAGVNSLSFIIKKGGTA